MVKRNIRPYYTIVCKIGDWDVSPNMQRITIISSINIPYQIFKLEMTADTKSFTLYNINESEDIRLMIKLMTEDSIPSESIDLELIMLDHSLPLSLREPTDKVHPSGDNIILYCLVKKPYEAMSTTVNKLYDEKWQLTPIQMVEDVIKTFIPGLDTEIHKENENPEKILQLIIPPMSFVDFLRYMDGNDEETINKYGPGTGLFRGPAFYHCRFENDTLCLWDLGKEISKQPSYTVYHLSQGLADKDIMRTVGKTDTEYYTYSNIKTKFTGSQDVAKYAYRNKFLSKPIDDLYTWHDITMDQVFEQQGIRDSGKMIYNRLVEKRTQYHTEGEIGLEHSDHMYMSRLSRKISTSSELVFHFDRNLALTKLARVGVPIELKPRVLEYEKYKGKYIVSNSRIVLSRTDGDSWICKTTITCFRGNLQI